MKLQGGSNISNFLVPKFFENISISYDSPLSQEEIRTFRAALIYVDKVIKESPPPMPLLSLNVYFSEHKPVRILLDEDAFGCYSQFILFPVQKWRELHFRRQEMFLPMIEELCHAVWQIPDGPMVDAKVTEVLYTAGVGMSKSEYLVMLQEYILSQRP